MYIYSTQFQFYVFLIRRLISYYATKGHEKHSDNSYISHFVQIFIHSINKDHQNANKLSLNVVQLLSERIFLRFQSVGTFALVNSFDSLRQFTALLDVHLHASGMCNSAEPTSNTIQFEIKIVIA